ncbi:MAG: MFS transporter, partial [Burkholderiaceae bacterium]
MKSVVRSPGARLAACFFTYFAMSGLLAPFMPLYFQSRGLSAAEVGMVMALAQGLRVVGSNFWGWMADRTHPRTRVLRLTAIAIAISFSGFLLPGGFGWIVVVMFFLNLFMTAQMPVAEALAMARLRGDPAAYGRLRVWGSVGYVIVVVGAGLLFDAAGIG